jgi:hypothetical protein
LEQVDGEWRIIGPARDEARIEFASAQPLQV